MQHLNATACAQPSSLEGEWELRDCGFKHLVPVKVAWNGIFSRLEITGAEHDVSVQVCHPSNASLPIGPCGMQDFGLMPGGVRHLEGLHVSTGLRSGTLPSGHHLI